MATEQPKPAAEDVKMDLFEDDDEFEEFAIDQATSSSQALSHGCSQCILGELAKFGAYPLTFKSCWINTEWEDKEEGKEVTQQWEDDWDDDDVNDDFALQLRKELESNIEKK